MTNVFGTPEKVAVRDDLFRAGIETLKNNGWTVERIPREGKASVRRITKGDVTKKVSIRTTQDRWIAFPRNDADNGWATLGEVDWVVAVSVDNRDNPRFAQVHMIDGDEMRARFDRAYAARRNAGYTLPKGRGVWVSLYDSESNDPVTHVGAGAGLSHPPIARVPLTVQSEAVERNADSSNFELNEAPLTIPEAKRRLAQSFGVSEDSIKITITS